MFGNEAKFARVPNLTCIARRGNKGKNHVLLGVKIRCEIIKSNIRIEHIIPITEQTSHIGQLFCCVLLIPSDLTSSIHSIQDPMRILCCVPWSTQICLDVIIVATGY